MSFPSARSMFLSGVLIIASVTATVQTVTAQHGPQRSAETVPRYAWYLEGLGAALVTLVIAGLLIALAPSYTQRVTDRALERPGTSFVVGLGLTIVVVILAIVLVVTVVGVFLAIPMLLVFAVVAVVTAEFGFLAAGRMVSDDWAPILLVAVSVAWFVGSVQVVGSLIGFLLASIGLGAFFLDVRSG